MTQRKNLNGRYINPFRKTELKFWARRWNITFNQVKDLLGVTGSCRVDVLQNYLQKTGLHNKIKVRYL